MPVFWVFFALSITYLHAEVFHYFCTTFPFVTSTLSSHFTSSSNSVNCLHVLLREYGVVMRPDWQQVLEKVIAMDNADNLICLFELLLTEDERHAIAGRLRVFQLLLDGQLSQRQIAAEYGVSIATITRCSNYLKNMSPELRQRISALIQ